MLRICPFQNVCVGIPPLCRLCVEIQGMHKVIRLLSTTLVDALTYISAYTSNNTGIASSITLLRSITWLHFPVYTSLQVVDNFYPATELLRILHCTYAFKKLNSLHNDIYSRSATTLELYAVLDNLFSLTLKISNIC